MGIGTPVSIGSASLTSDAGGTASFTTTQNILAGDFVFLTIASNNASPVGATSVTDGTNTYIKADATTASGQSSSADIWYKENCQAVAAGATVTFTMGNTTSNGLELTGARVSGMALANSLDKHTTQNGSSTPSVTIGPLTVPVELVVGVIGVGGTGPTGLSGSAGFTDFYNHRTSNNNCWMDVGYVITSTTSNVTYSPTPTGTGNQNNAVVIASFQGFIVVHVDAPEPIRPSRSAIIARSAAALMRGSDGIEAPMQSFVSMGFHVQPPQPPHPRPEKWAAIAQGDQGDEAPFTFTPPTVFAEGWAIQPPQPPARQNIINRAAATMLGDDGTQAPLIVPFPEGWQVQPPQPPNPQASPRVRAAGIMRGEDGTEATLIRFFPVGFEVQPHQPQHPTPEKRAAATMRGDDGVYGGLVRFFSMGWEPVLHQPRHPTPEKRAGAIARWEDGDEAKFVFTPQTPAGWEGAPQPLPRWPRPRVAGALAKGIDGIERPFFAILNRFDFGPESFQPPRRPLPGNRAGALMRGDDGIAAVFFAARWGFDSVQPDLRYQRRLIPANSLGDTWVPFGTPAWGWEPSPAPLRKQGRTVFEQGALVVPPFVSIQAAAFSLDTTELFYRPRRRLLTEMEPFWPSFKAPAWGFEAQLPLLRRRNATLIPPLDEGRIEVGISPNWVQDPAPFQPRRRRLPNLGPAAPDPLIRFYTPTVGWDVQAWQPPATRFKRGGALMRGEDGTEQMEIVPYVSGWQPVLVFPPHPRPERAGAIMQGDMGGQWGIFSYTVPSGAIGFVRPYWVAVPFIVGLPP